MPTKRPFQEFTQCTKIHWCHFQARRQVTLASACVLLDRYGPETMIFHNLQQPILSAQPLPNSLAAKPRITLPLPTIVHSKIRMMFLVITPPSLVPIRKQQRIVIHIPSLDIEKQRKIRINGLRLPAWRDNARTLPARREDGLLVRVEEADVEHVVCTAGVGAVRLVLLVLCDVCATPAWGVFGDGWGDRVGAGGYVRVSGLVFDVGWGSAKLPLSVQTVLKNAFWMCCLVRVVECRVCVGV